MKHSTYSIIIGIILLACAWYLNHAFIGNVSSSAESRANEDENTITAQQMMERKNLHTTANEITRKPFIIQTYSGEVCAERIEQDGHITSLPYIESYCYGVYGPMPKIWPPDSLQADIHHQMIDSLQHHALRHGYIEPWQRRSPLEGSPPKAGGVSSEASSQEGEARQSPNH